VLDSAEADQERRERERIFEQPLSTEKESAFRSEILSAWRTDGYVRAAFARAGSVRYSTDQPPPTAKYTGIDALTLKSAFVDDAGAVIWSDPFRPFGEAIAQAENAGILSVLREGAPVYVPGRRLVSDKVAQIIRVMNRLGTPPDLIVLLGTFDTLDLFEASGEYRPVDLFPPDRRSLSFLGEFLTVPIYFDRRADGEDSDVVVISTKKAAELTCYAPDADALFRTSSIDTWSLDEAMEIARGNRTWLPGEVRELPGDQLVDYLRERVRIQIQSALTVDIRDERAVRVLRVEAKSNNDA
jgi:hypothetical protein